LFCSKSGLQETLPYENSEISCTENKGDLDEHNYITCPLFTTALVCNPLFPHVPKWCLKTDLNWTTEAPYYEVTSW